MTIEHTRSFDYSDTGLYIQAKNYVLCSYRRNGIGNNHIDHFKLSELITELCIDYQTGQRLIRQLTYDGIVCNLYEDLFKLTPSYKYVLSAADVENIAIRDAAIAAQKSKEESQNAIGLMWCWGIGLIVGSIVLYVVWSYIWWVVVFVVCAIGGGAGSGK